jgi:hypothetical protein
VVVFHVLGKTRINCRTRPRFEAAVTCATRQNRTQRCAKGVGVYATAAPEVRDIDFEQCSAGPSLLRVGQNGLREDGMYTSFSEWAQPPHPTHSLTEAIQKRIDAEGLA